MTKDTNRLAQARKAAGLTQQQLAVRTGTAVSTIAQAERGVKKLSNMRTGIVCALAETLGVTPAWLAGCGPDKDVPIEEAHIEYDLVRQHRLENTLSHLS